jgi:hypothetical protein
MVIAASNLEQRTRPIQQFSGSFDALIAAIEAKRSDILSGG